MKKYLKWIVLTTGIFTASILSSISVSRKISRFVVDTALDRIEPKRIKGAKHPNSTVISEETVNLINNFTEKLKSSDLETVEITADDGEKLIGHWYENPNAKRILIAMHGWRSSWAKDFSAISPFWQENNCSILYAEQRGQGDSGGDYMGFGMIERHDCKNWIEWVNQRTNKTLPIYLAGISMGASTVLMTAGFSLPENVKGIMADCGFTSAHAIWKHVVEGSTRFSYDFRKKAIEDLCKKKIRIGTQHYTTLDAMKTCKIPVLLVHGTDDTFVPVEMTYENYKACSAPKKLFIVPGAGHAMSYLTDKKGYEKAVLHFWNSFDNA